MAHVRAFLDPEPPPRLYHYTTAKGLLGIIDKKEIWASHTQYLNDQFEFQHAVSLIKEESVAMREMPEHDAQHPLLDQMASSVEDRDSINVCVCSFSECGDVLSQWRAYGRGAGFSVSFSGPFLRGVSRKERFWLVKCIYEEADQRSLLRTLLNDVLGENTQKELDGRGEERIPGGNLAAYLNRYAPILKHKSFAAEKEWRIISRPLSCTRERFEFRPGTSMLVPYFRIPLAGAAETLQIEEILVGPTPHPHQSRQSVQSLLLKHGLRTTKVHNTVAPFRNW
jgi:hypothetical protein